MFGKLSVWYLLTLMKFFENWELLAKKKKKKILNLSADLRANDIDIYHVTDSVIKAFYIPLPFIFPKDPLSDLHHHPILQFGNQGLETFCDSFKVMLWIGGIVTKDNSDQVKK